MNRSRLILGIGGIAIAAAIAITVFYIRSESGSDTVATLPAAPEISPVTQASPPTTAVTKAITAQSIPGAHPAYTFAATVPTSWQAEAVSGTDAINLYDPAVVGSSNLEKSQIFMRFFEANQFLTLSTVTIHEQSSTTINGRPAVRYDIEKKPSVAQFPNQPAWRSEQHIVTDIRTSDTSPSIFYVIAKSPTLDEAAYQEFLQSLQVDSARIEAGLQPPIAEFTERITKKPFGIYITPATSPVQPERFTGYHTGVDIEYADVTGDVPVVAITAGRVMAARTATGYGGVVVIEHEIEGTPRAVIYGHLDPASLPEPGATVTAGQSIGLLGDHESSATDGERKHLHFAVLKSNTVDLRGYVQDQSELTAWQDPAPLF